MDNSLRRHGSRIRSTNSFRVSWQVFDDILHWLIGLIQLTEQEQMDAGIYLGDQSFGTSTQKDDLKNKEKIK